MTKICIAKLSRNRHCAGLAQMAFKSSSVINLVYSYKANHTRFECSLLFQSSYQSGLFSSQSLSLPPKILPISTFISVVYLLPRGVWVHVLPVHVLLSKPDLDVVEIVSAIAWFQTVKDLVRVCKLWDSDLPTLTV